MLRRNKLRLNTTRRNVTRMEATKGEPMNPQPNPQLVPLTLVAAEIGGDANALAAKIGDAIVLDGIGLRCLTADRARTVIADHRAAVQAQRDQRRAEVAEARRRPDPLRERVRAIARAQERFGGADLPALAVMTAGDIEGRLEVSSKHLDELLTGDPHYHSLSARELSRDGLSIHHGGTPPPAAGGNAARP